MSRIRGLFLLLTVVGPLHMIEQLLTDIEEFHMIKRSLASYYALFEPADADWATVVLVTIVWTALSLLFYAMLHDGRTRLIVPGMLGLFSITEIHHVLEALQKRGYDPGLVSCVPYAVVGALLVAAVWREVRHPQRSAGAPALVASPGR